MGSDDAPLYFEHIMNKSKKTVADYPHLTGKMVVMSTCLATTHPQLIKEWDIISNLSWTPYNVTHGSSRVMHWMCDKGHKYTAAIGDRTRGCGCHICNKASAPENGIAEILDLHNLWYRREYQNEKCRFKKRLRFDFALFASNDFNLLPIGIIEFNGPQHFQQVIGWNDIKTEQKRDQIKRDFCIAQRIPLLEIADESLIEEQVTLFLKGLKLI